MIGEIFFIGYCSSSASTAEVIRSYIEGELGASVLDWKRDFGVARSVLEEIAEAGKRCSAGIFLFTKDDFVSEEENKRTSLRSIFGKRSESIELAIPRDNVVFEAGYFIGVRGKRKVLIVREDGAKMPADLGGDVYALLENRHDIDPIKDLLRRFAMSI